MKKTRYCYLYGSTARGICPFKTPGGTCRECTESLVSFGISRDKTAATKPKYLNPYVLFKAGKMGLGAAIKEAISIGLNPAAAIACGILVSSSDILNGVNAGDPEVKGGAG
jgi:hypothetical protein